jgi:DNA repair protein RadC
VTRAGNRDRPREKLARLGVSALGDNELLALVLGAGTSQLNALALANLLLASNGGLHGIPSAGRDELLRVPGVGEARAAQVLASIELGRRTLLRDPDERPQLLTPRDAAFFLLPEFGARPVEHFGVVLVDTRHRVLKTSLLTVGTLDRSVVHPREVFREAAAARAAAVILFHNHPSGDPTPSADDEALTRRMLAAGEIMGIEVLDHVVLAGTKYASVRERGRLASL